MFSIPRAGLTCDAPIRAPLRLDRVIRSLSNSIFSRSDVDPRLFRYIRGNDGTLPLSSAYTAAVDGALGGHDRSMLVHAGRQVIGDLSKYAHVRQNHCPTPNEYLRYGDYECLAYLYTHAGAALYCTKSILEELAFRLRGFSPTSVLDAGFGPGIGFIAANEVYDHVEEIVCTNHHSSMLRLANNVWSCYPHDKNQNIKYTRLPLPSFKNTKCYDLVVCGYTLSTNLNDLRRELIAEAAWNLTKKILIFVEFGTPHGVKCINRAKEIIVRKNKNRSPEDTANVIAPDPHGVVLSSLNPEFYIFERRVAVPTTLKKPFALLTSKHYSIVKYSYLVIIRGNPPNNADRVNHLVKRSILDENMSLLSSVTDTELADASFTWPRILYTNVVRPSNIILKLSCISADCVDLQIAKNEESYSRAAALLARSSRPGGLWPLL